MKLGKIFSVLAAAVLLFAGCNEKEDLGSQKLELSASSVSFDAATEGSQTITITATRDWTAVPSENWITVGPASGKGSASAQTVTISVSANSEVDRTGTVKFTAGSIVRTLNVSQKGEAGESLEVVYDAELGAPLEVEGQVVAINKNGVVITDGKTNVVVYNKASEYKAPEGIAIGDKVSVKGVRGQYEGQTNFPQITMESEGYTDLVKLSSGTAVYPEPVVITAANIDEEILKTKSSYVEMSGILSISGFYGNVAIEGTSKEGSLEGMIEGAFDEYVGVPATFRGYFAGTPKGAKYYKLIVSSVEVSSEPYLDLGKEALSLASTETAAEVEVISNTDWTVTLSGSASWITDYTKSGNGKGKITIACQENSTSEARTATLTVSAGAVSKTVTLTQAGKTTGQQQATLSFVNWEFEGADGWDSSYKERTVEFNLATVKFASANKQSNTITDCPVTKGGDVELIMKGSAELSTVKVNLKQWTSKTQTASLYASTDGGLTYQASAVVESSDFVLDAKALPTGTNAVKVTFSSQNNQVGIMSFEITYSE